MPCGRIKKKQWVASWEKNKSSRKGTFESMIFWLSLSVGYVSIPWGVVILLETKKGVAIMLIPQETSTNDVTSFQLPPSTYFFRWFSVVDQVSLVTDIDFPDFDLDQEDPLF